MKLNITLIFLICIIIVVFLCIINLIVYLCKQNKVIESFSSPIDLVYTWVDGRDPNWIKKKKKYSNTINNYEIDSNTPERFKDNNELLYSLRSIELYANWVRHIYIVTDNQKPIFLKPHPKITIIDHTQIIPNKYLPTFNSHVIELHLGNIPNLSNYFLYSNDDTFFNRKTNKSYFFEKNKPILYYNNWYCIKNSNDILKSNNSTSYVKAWNNNKKLLTRYNYPIELFNCPHHQITLCSKKYLNKIKTQFPEEYEQTSFTKFRDSSNIQPIGLSLFLAHIDDKFVQKKSNNIYVSYRLDMGTIEELLYLILKKTTNLFCINATMCSNNSVCESNVLKNLKYHFKEFYKEKFPNKSSYEV